MYKGIAFSPKTTITEDINAGSTVIKVADASVFPEAPNLATIGTDEDAETILYSAKSGDSLSGCTRGVEGTAKSWSSGALIARNFTAVEYGYIVDNIKQLFDEQEFTARINEEGHLIITLGTGTEVDCGNAKGDKGATGPKGNDGYTPQKGTDYFTPQDIQSIVEELKQVALLLTGGTMTGPLILNGDPTEKLGAATKQYADKKASKVSGATAGNLATLASDGGIQDSGKSIGSVMGVACVDATSSDGIAYTASVEGMTSIPDGAVISIVPNMDAADHEHINLNVNGLGAKYLQPMEIGKFDPLSGGGVSYPKMLSRGRAYLLQYDESADVWVILSSPSGSVYYMSGTFGGTVMAKSGSQPESFSCIRNIKLQSSTPSTVPNGELVGVYE